MSEGFGREYSGSPVGVRTIIQLIATTMAIVLFVIGIQMAYGVYHLVQQTLLSPEHFARIVDAWAEPIRQSGDEEEREPPAPLTDEDQTPVAQAEPAEVKPPSDAPRAPSDSDRDGSHPPDTADHSAIVSDPSVPEETASEEAATGITAPEAEESGNSAVAGHSDVEELAGEVPTTDEKLGEDQAENNVDQGAAAPRGDAAWPPPREAMPPPVSPLDALDRMLTNLKEQELGRAAAGFLIVLILFVLVKIPIALLTIGGSILSSVLKSSQTVQSITVRSGKSNSGGGRGGGRDDSNRPLNVGDLTS